MALLIWKNDRLLSFIDSLPKELSDLEEAAKEYALLFADGSKWMDDGKYRGFIAGANWQKEQLKDKDNER